MEEKKMSLWDLQRLAADTIAELEDNGGELTPEIEQALATTEEQIPAKIDGYKGFLDYLASQEGMIDGMIKDLQRKKKAVQNAQKNVKENLKNVMQCFGLTKIKGDVYTASIRTAATTEVDEDALLQPYRFDMERASAKLPPYVTVELKVSKTELNNLLKEGYPMPSGVTNGETVILNIR